MIERKYSWKYGHGGVSAQVAGETIKKIEDRDGVITSEAFLDESRPEDAPTHNCFDWNDSEAAEKWRLWQAGQVIRDIVVTIVDSDKEQEPIKTPMFVNTSIKGSNKAYYTSTETALVDDVLRDNVLNNAKAELRAFRKKYERLKELSNVFNEIDKLLDN